ncbi:hypothetical protein MPL3356_140191 [Mesorhizobium plurifarium]|uniref:Uncharacterized protein n=1 Tax=Mesorhizobium plurifarium TaxID=69974 RepID=A0A090DJ30_MESPL|nr:hypothetical protein MPL3356_140191 [Mesorhizobium plurifarium]
MFRPFGNVLIGCPEILETVLIGRGARVCFQPNTPQVGVPLPAPNRDICRRVKAASLPSIRRHMLADRRRLEVIDHLRREQIAGGVPCRAGCQLRALVPSRNAIEPGGCNDEDHGHRYAR